MMLPYCVQKKPNYLALSFALPVFGMLSVMAVRGFVPFGNQAMLYSDMYHQYYPFFVSFRRALLSGDSLLYTWNIGLGMDYLGLYAYYLASPLNLLSVFVPDNLLLEFFSLLMPIKLGFAGLSFAFFLKKAFERNDISLPLFGCFYATCAWALGYQWNIMWLDTFALLPLVVLGTVALLRDKKCILYTVSLFFSIFCNYYIGFFTCIFVFLLFVCYQVCYWQGFRKLTGDFFRIALYSLLAIGMTAVLFLPALTALQNTQSSANTFPQTFRLNMVSEHTFKGLLIALGKTAGNLSGGVAPTFKEGLPNLYCGIGTLVLSFLFLTSRQIKLRDKVVSVLLLLFFMVSFSIRQLDYLWHGFHFPNMIPYRFSFLFSFVMLYMAYRAYLVRFCFQFWQVLVSGVFVLCVFLCSDSRTNGFFLAFNGAFLLLYLVILGIYCLSGSAIRNHLSACIPEQKRCRAIADKALAVVLILELGVNFANFGVRFPGTPIGDYPKGTTRTVAAVAKMQDLEKDNLFYRAETTQAQTLNDGALNGYRGISAFTSSANVHVTNFMEALGFAAKNTYNRYEYADASPVSNLFLGLKYMIDREQSRPENPYFRTVATWDSVQLLENSAYLPFGFLANPALADLAFTNPGDRFAFQNRLIAAATGYYPVWLPNKQLYIASTDVSYTTKTDAGYCAYTANNSGTIQYCYTANSLGLMVVDMHMSQRCAYRIYKNGKCVFADSYTLPQMLSVGQVAPGDIVEIAVKCQENTKGTLSIAAAIMDDDLFQQAYSILNASTLQLSAFSNTRLAGTISCNRDGVLYISIPQDGNWHAEVDSKPANTLRIGNAMLGIPLKKGAHSVVLRYRNPAFSLGVRISVVCLLIFMGLGIYSGYKKKNHRQ